MPKHQDPQWRSRIAREHRALRARGLRYFQATAWLTDREGVSAAAVLLAVGVAETDVRRLRLA